MSSAPENYFVREMAMVHRMFRREFLLAPGVVRRADGDAHRIREVAAHLRFISATLHEHRTGEDRYAWPLLAQRAPAQLADHLAAVTAQHRQVDDVQSQFDVELATWCGGASLDSTEQLATVLERLAQALTQHMDYEERNVVPLMGAHIGFDEWNRIVDTMMAELGSPSDAMLVLGMSMYEGDDDIIDNIVSRMPDAIRAGIRDTAAMAY